MQVNNNCGSNTFPASGHAALSLPEYATSPDTAFACLIKSLHMACVTILQTSRFEKDRLLKE